MTDPQPKEWRRWTVQWCEHLPMYCWQILAWKPGLKEDNGKFVELIELGAVTELRRENEILQADNERKDLFQNDLFLQINQLKAKLAECEAELVRLKDDLISYCSFCTFEAPVGTTSFADLQAHVKVCEFHPLNKKISMRDKQLAIAKKTLSNIMRGPCCLICECHSCNAKKALNEIESMETDHDQAK